MLVLLGLPAGGLAEFVTRGYIRVGTTLGFFAALVSIDTPPGRRPSTIRIAILFVTLTLTFLSDPYALFVGAPAFLVVCLLGAARVKSYEDIRVGRVALAVIGAAATANVLSRLIEKLGGYRVVPIALPDALAIRNPLRRVVGSRA